MVQIIAQRLTVVWRAKCELWCKLWIQLLVGLNKILKNVNHHSFDAHDGDFRPFLVSPFITYFESRFVSRVGHPRTPEGMGVARYFVRNVRIDSVDRSTR